MSDLSLGDCIKWFVLELNKRGAIIPEDDDSWSGLFYHLKNFQEYPGKKPECLGLLTFSLDSYPFPRDSHLSSVLSSFKGIFSNNKKYLKISKDVIEIYENDLRGKLDPQTKAFMYFSLGWIMGQGWFNSNYSLVNEDLVFNDVEFIDLDN